MILVRRLKVSDLPALEAIETKLMQRQPRRQGWLVGFRKMVERTLAEEPEGLLIADVDDKVVGSAIARQQGKHPMSGLRYGHIYNISVDPDAKAAGVGVRLLRECEAYLRSRGCASVQLSLPVDAVDQAEMFKNAGYTVASWELERIF